MAALEDSPSRCQGQSWTLWAQRVGFNLTGDETEADGQSGNKREGDAMKLRKEDMALFGFCPAQDEFYLVVCELCGQVVKPQALKTHIELRHSSNSITRFSGGSSSSNSSQHSHSLSKTAGKDPHHHSHQHTSSSTFSSSGERLGQASKTSSCSPKHNVGHLHQSKGGGHCKSESKTSALAGSKKNHSLSSPVVRMERMSPSLMIKKVNSTMGPPGSAVSPAAIPVDKRELPSPQQPPPPPPPPMFLPSPASPSLPLPSSATLLQHGQLQQPQQHHPVFATPSGSSYTGTSLNQGISSSAASSLTSSSQSLHKKAAINAAFVALSNSSASHSSESKPKPSKSKSKVPKERKLLPCKDRVYDPDKHCGVFIQEIGKQCTRSLTCKTHSLAMRRNVAGRRKNFDELLADHRAAKEALGKAAAMLNNSSAHSQISSCNESAGSGTIVATVTSASSILSGGSSAKVIQGSTKLNSSINGGSAGLSAISSSAGSQKLQMMSPAKSKSANSRSNSSGVALPRPMHSLMSGSSTLDSSHKLSGDCNGLLANVSSVAVSKEDNGYVTHHPRPAAICTYNSRQMGLGFFVCDRRLDSIRAALRTALGERFIQPPPIKKLCVESKLPPVPEPTDPSDPYCFLSNEQRASPVPAGTLASAASSSITSSLASVAVTSSITTTTSVVGAVTASSKSSQSRIGKASRLSKSKQNKDNGASNNTSTNHVSRTSNCAGSMRTGQDVNGGSGSVNLPPPGKRKRSSSAANKCSSLNNVTSASPLQKPSQSSVSHVHGVSSQSAAAPAGLLSVSFPLSINAQLATPVSHLGTSKNGSVTPPVIPTCPASGQGVRNHATLATANSLKDLNLVVTSVEVMNGQLGHGTGPVLARTSGTTCIPVTAAGTIRSSLSGLGIGLATHTLTLTAGGSIAATLNPGPNRASVSSSSCSSSGMPSITPPSLSSTLSSSAKDGKPLSAKRAKSSSSAKSSRSAHSIAALSPCPSKWMVNNTTVLTGLGALSNANFLSGTLTANNHIAMPALSSNNLSPPGLTSSANLRPSSMSPHLSSSSSPLPNGLGSSPPPMPLTSPHHKNLTNHIMPDNTATFIASPGVHNIITSPDHSLSNCDVLQHKGKGFRANSSMKCSSIQKTTHQHHPSLPSIHSNSGLPVVSGKTFGSYGQVLGGANLGSARLPSSASGAALLAAMPLAGKHSSSSQGSVGSTSTSLPLPSSSSIPIKMLTTASMSSTKSQHPKPFILPMDELRRPSEMQGSPTLPT